MTTSLSRSRQAGFSLIEIMVAVVIGMIGVIIMTQVLMQSDSARRNTTSGDDAQINASIALSGLERDIRMSGYGLNSLNLLGCTWTFTPSNETSVLTTGLSIGPVVINPGTNLVPAGDANTDTLLVMYGSSNSPGEGDALIAASSSTSYKMTTAPSFAENDRTIAVSLPRTATCAVKTDRVTNVPGDGTIAVAAGVSGIKAGDVIYNLGARPVVRAYAVRNGNLTVCDYTAYNCSKTSYTSTLNSDVWVPVGNNVVSLRAQYGHDKTAGTMTGVVTDFDRTTPSSSAFPACEWARLLTLRLAVVARGGQYDKDVVTDAVPTWTGSEGIAFNLGDGSDWKHYRYKTVETAVPLRNMLWQGGQPSYQGGESGC